MSQEELLNQRYYRVILIFSSAEVLTVAPAVDIERYISSDN
jgi:hypothetical protein